MTSEGTAGKDGELTGELLRAVSRSFYVSVRLLPRQLRDPVGLAYLLARATDTLADTTDVAASVRKTQLQVLGDAIQNGASTESLGQLQRAFVPLQRNDDERKLIEALPECFHRLDQLDRADARDIRIVLGKITEAQRLDVSRFADPTKVLALTTATELQDYAYLIAGCVGEFWTELGQRHVPDFADRAPSEMRDLGKRYGVGLQLINILRDAHGDLRVGRCYFPADELRAAGLAPADILGHPVVFKPIFEKWLNAAESGLEAGMEYTAALRDRRVRAATALPALIGARTIALLREAGTRALQEKVKVTRSEVRGMLASVAITLAGRATLARMFRKNLGGR